MYNFHKVKNNSSKGIKNEENSWEFKNEYFLREKPNLIDNIKRKANDNSAQTLFYDLHSRYNELFIYIKYLQEELIKVKDDNRVLNEMIENLRVYTNEKCM